MWCTINLAYSISAVISNYTDYAAFIICLVLTLFVIILNMTTVQNIFPWTASNLTLAGEGNVTNDNVNPCQISQICLVICQTYWISQVIFSIFFLIWNLLVSVVLVSVARTQVLKVILFGIFL